LKQKAGPGFFSGRQVFFVSEKNLTIAPASQFIAIVMAEGTWADPLGRWFRKYQVRRGLDRNKIILILYALGKRGL
jgi:hypothetical protein